MLTISTLLEEAISDWLLNGDLQGQGSSLVLKTERPRAAQPREASTSSGDPIHHLKLRLPSSQPRGNPGRSPINALWKGRHRHCDQRLNGHLQPLLGLSGWTWLSWTQVVQVSATPHRYGYPWPSETITSLSPHQREGLLFYITKDSRHNLPANDQRQSKRNEPRSVIHIAFPFRSEGFSLEMLMM